MARRVTETALNAGRETFVPAAPLVTSSPATAVSTSAVSTIVLPSKNTSNGLPRRLASAGGWVAWFSLLWAALFVDDVWRMLPAFVLAVSGSWGIIVLARSWDRPADDSLSRRLLIGLLGVSLGLAAVWLEGYDLFARDPDNNAHVPRIDNTPKSRFFRALRQ